MPDFASWRATAPRLAEECAERWSLTLGDPFPADSAASLALPAQTSDGEDVVLKVQFPHRESDHEADALALWDGGGAVRLLAYDPERHALLIERCIPGTPLAEVGAEQALDVLIGTLPRLWKPADGPFNTLADEAAWWAAYLPSRWEQAGRPFERAILDAALHALESLPPTQGEHVLLHQDLHGDNVLAAQREPWLVIDPKPLAGEREFSVAPIVRSFELGHSEHDVRRRFDRLTSELGLDRDRARGWAIGQTIAWTFDSSYHARHVETARWLMEMP